MTNGIIGTEGFVAWFYSLIYMRVVRACKNIFVKIIVHSIGLIVIIIGLFALKTITPPTHILGIILIFAGVVVFITPFGVNAEL